MTIVKSNQAKKLEVGTVVTASNGNVEIVSEYDEFRGGFTVAELAYVEEEDDYIKGDERFMTLHDFVGCNY